MTGDTARKVLDRLQELQKDLHGQRKTKHGQNELDFKMYEYDPEEDVGAVMASGDSTSKGSFSSEEVSDE